MKKISVLLLPLLLNAAPDAPSHIQTVASSNSVTISWHDRSDDERGFKIFRNGKFIALLPTNSVSYTDRGLNGNTFYRYEVRATDDRDSSLNSIKAVNKNGNLILSLDGNLAEGSHANFFIDADNNPATGYTNSEIVGAEYLISDGRLHRYPDGARGWNWDLVSRNIQEDKTDKKFISTIALNSMNLGKTIKYSARVSSSDWNINTNFSNMKELTIDNDGKTPIVIVGSSTVHIVNEVDDEVHEDRTPCTLEGWGEIIPEFATDSDSIYNLARAGASSGSFLIPPDHQQGKYALLFGPNKDHHWAKTKEKMESLGGGILLIQFGGNDLHQLEEKYSDEALRYKHFKFNLQLYIDTARALNFTPVMITPPNSRDLGADGRVKDVREGYPNAMKELGKSEGVRVLDLHKKSLEEFRKLSQNELDSNFGNCYRKNENGTISRDRTHFEEHGARTVARWIRDLACEDPNSKLCREFK